jgi:hypothetical protein
VLYPVNNRSLIRLSRPGRDTNEAKQGLKRLGATEVWTYDELNDKNNIAKIKEALNGKVWIMRIV